MDDLAEKPKKWGDELEDESTFSASPEPIPAKARPASRQANRIEVPAAATVYDNFARRKKIGVKNIGILGLSASGKTCFLSMFYHSTAEAANIPDHWLAEWRMEGDGGRTDQHLSEIATNIAGYYIPDPNDLKRQVFRRKIPDGTKSDIPIHFRLTRKWGRSKEKLEVLTLDYQGEVAEAALSEGEDRLNANLASQWANIKNLCEGSDALLVFTNLLTQQYVKNEPGKLRRLLEWLLAQEKHPRCIAFVVTGFDAIEEGKMSRKEEETRRRLEPCLRLLKGKGIPSKIIPVGSLGRSMIQKKAEVQLALECLAPDHRCPKCQELVQDPAIQPKPIDLHEPFEYVFRRLLPFHKRSERLSVVLKNVQYLAMASLLCLIAWILFSTTRTIRQEDQEYQSILALALDDESTQLDEMLRRARSYRDTYSNYTLFSGISAHIAHLDQVLQPALDWQTIQDPVKPGKDSKLEDLRRMQDFVQKYPAGKLTARADSRIQDIRFDLELTDIQTATNMNHRLDLLTTSLAKWQDTARAPLVREQATTTAQDLVATVERVAIQVREIPEELAGIKVELVAWSNWLASWPQDLPAVRAAGLKIAGAIRGVDQRLQAATARARVDQCKSVWSRSLATASKGEFSAALKDLGTLIGLDPEWNAQEKTLFAQALQHARQVEPLLERKEWEAAIRHLDVVHLSSIPELKTGASLLRAKASQALDNERMQETYQKTRDGFTTMVDPKNLALADQFGPIDWKELRINHRNLESAGDLPALTDSFRKLGLKYSIAVTQAIPEAELAKAKAEYQESYQQNADLLLQFSPAALEKANGVIQALGSVPDSTSKARHYRDASRILDIARAPALLRQGLETRWKQLEDAYEIAKPTIEDGAPETLAGLGTRLAKLRKSNSPPEPLLKDLDEWESGLLKAQETASRVIAERQEWKAKLQDILNQIDRLIDQNQSLLSEENKSGLEKCRGLTREAQAERDKQKSLKTALKALDVLKDEIQIAHSRKRNKRAASIGS